MRSIEPREWCHTPGVIILSHIESSSNMSSMKSKYSNYKANVIIFVCFQLWQACVGDGIFGCLLVNIVIIKEDYRKASFGFVGSYDIHHSG